MASLNSARGKAIIMLAHVAGMIDLVAMPVWVGTLVQHYGYDFKRAGMTVTVFLVGVVLASLLCASRFTALPRRKVVISGYALAGAGFLGAMAAASPAVMLALHLVSGIGAGCSLSITHGTIGRSTNPHRLFATVGAALGLFAVIFYACVPHLIAATGGASLFAVLGGLMILAALAAWGFPEPDIVAQAHVGAAEPFSFPAKLAILGVICMALNQAIIFSFLERIGVTRGFGANNVNLVLAVLGMINLFPAVLAGMLQHRLKAQTVAIWAPVVQAALAITIAGSPSFGPYAAAASFYAFVMIFAHTFLFGLIAKLDPSGRALAMTPAMLMIGSAIGPALAGAVAQGIGFWGLGVAAAVVATVAVSCFVRVSHVLAEGGEVGLMHPMPK